MLTQRSDLTRPSASLCLDRFSNCSRAIATTPRLASLTDIRSRKTKALGDPHLMGLATDEPVKIFQDHATSRSPDQHTQLQSLSISIPPSGSSEQDTTRRHDVFGGAQEMVRFQKSAKQPRLSPSLS